LKGDWGLTVSAQVEILVASNAADSCLPPAMLVVPGHPSVHGSSSRKATAFPVQAEKDGFGNLRTMLIIAGRRNFRNDKCKGMHSVVNHGIYFWRMDGKVNFDQTLSNGIFRTVELQL